MKTNDLTIANLSNEHGSMANVFYKAIKYAYPDLKNLVVTYDGKRINFDFDGDIIIKNKVLATANYLINSVMDKPKFDFDIASILNNSNEVMKSVHGDDWRDKVKDVPYVYIDKQEK